MPPISPAQRIGMYGWANSGIVWYRHFLRCIGVDLDRLQWWIGDIDAPRASTVAASLPPGVNQPPAGPRRCRRC